MKLKDYKKTPFFRKTKYLIKLEGWENFKKKYKDYIQNAKLWLSLQNTIKNTEKLLKEVKIESFNYFVNHSTN